MAKTLDECILIAIAELSAIPYFPASRDAQRVIMRAIAKFVEDPRHLRWLVDAAVEAMAEWKGVQELRGLYCTRWKPKDGKESDCTLSGFSPAELEAKSIDAHLALKMGRQQEQIAGPPREKMPADELEAFQNEVLAGPACEWPRFMNRPTEGPTLAEREAKLAEDAAAATRLTEQQRQVRLLELQMKLGISESVQ